MKRSIIRSLISRHLLASDLGTGDEPIVDESEVETQDGDILILSFSLIIVGVFIGYCYETYSFFHKVERYFPHASCNMIFGFFVGLILSLTGTLNEVFSFDPEFFFVYLLPPIIFSAGYNLPKDFFFHNFGSIMTFAFIGTTLSAFFIGASLTAFGEIGIITNLSFTKNMMLGSLISAVDPVAVILVLKSLSVDEQLKVLLFGESVLNDAASVVINRVFVSIDEGGKSTSEALAPAIPQIAGIAIASMLIGTVIALFVAFLHKISLMKVKKDCYEIELAAFLLGAFLPYGIAEALGLSGICSVLFAGIMTDYYTFHHLSKQSQITTRHTVSTLSYISELFVFIYLGMSFFLEEGHEFRTGYVIVTLILCFIGRAISVFPLAFLLNMGRKHKLPFKHQVVLWYSGLRGPVAYALAVATPPDADFPLANNIIVTTTISIVAFTTLMLGGMAYPFLRWLKPPIMRSTQQTKTDTYDISNHWFNRLDRRFLRPLFGPKSRRNVNRPLTSLDEIEMEEEQEKNQSNGSDVDPKLQLMNNSKNENKSGFDMKYIGTNTNEEEAERAEQDSRTNSTTTTTQKLKKGGTGKKKRRRSSGGDRDDKKSDNIDSVSNNNNNNTLSPSDPDKSGLIDYSMPRTVAPSFIDNPRENEQSASNTQTWSDMNSLNTSQVNINMANSMNNLEAPIAENKSVTPPPQSFGALDGDNNDSVDIMSSIQND